MSTVALSAAVSHQVDCNYSHDNDSVVYTEVRGNLRVVFPSGASELVKEEPKQSMNLNLQCAFPI